MELRIGCPKILNSHGKKHHVANKSWCVLVLIFHFGVSSGNQTWLSGKWSVCGDVSEEKAQNLDCQLPWFSLPEGFPWWQSHILVGGLNPSEKYLSIGMMKFPIYGKIKNVPNHQPEYWPAISDDSMIPACSGQPAPQLRHLRTWPLEAKPRVLGHCRVALRIHWVLIIRKSLAIKLRV